MSYDNGFSRAAPNGNSLVDGFKEPKYRRDEDEDLDLEDDLEEEDK